MPVGQTAAVYSSRRECDFKEGINPLKFEEVYKAGNGQEQPCYQLPRRKSTNQKISLLLALIKCLIIRLNF